MKDETLKSVVVDNISFHPNRPTELGFRQLYSWIIWQMPRKKSNGLCAAVHPPIAGHGWLPAIILKENRIQVHAHLNAIFATPEEAIAFLCAETTS